MLTTTLPNDQALEGVVLGIAMTNADVAMNIVTEVDGADFFHQSHQVVFGALRSLCERGVIADSAAIVSELKSNGQLDRMGGQFGGAIPYVRGLAMSAPEPTNASEYVGQLKALSLRRALITQASEALRLSTDMSVSAEDLVDRTALKFADLAVHRYTPEPMSAREFARFEWKDYERRKQSDGMLGLSTGYPDVDNLTGGLERQTLTLIAGRPSMGKSVLAGLIALNAAKKGVPVLIFSLEMPSTSMFRRMLASEARVSAKNLRRGRLDDDGVAKMSSVLGVIGDLPLHIDPDSGLSELEIRARARRHKWRFGLGLVVVDHIQLVRSDTRERTRDTEIGNVSRGLKNLSKDLDIPVIALSQLNRSIESRPIAARKPTLADLRDSGNLEQDADVVLGLYREGYYKPNTDRPNELDVGALKVREGEPGSTVLHWNPKILRFDNLCSTGALL